MKKGKIILGVAALVVSAAGTLAFKARIGTHKIVYGPTVAGGVCITSTCFTKTGASSGLRCHTAIVTVGSPKLVLSSSGKLWTGRTVGGHCANVANFTHIN